MTGEATMAALTLLQLAVLLCCCAGSPHDLSPMALGQLLNCSGLPQPPPPLSRGAADRAPPRAAVVMLRDAASCAASAPCAAVARTLVAASPALRARGMARGFVDVAGGGAAAGGGAGAGGAGGAGALLADALGAGERVRRAEPEVWFFRPKRHVAGAGAADCGSLALLCSQLLVGGSRLPPRFMLGADGRPAENNLLLAAAAFMRQGHGFSNATVALSQLLARGADPARRATAQRLVERGGELDPLVRPGVTAAAHLVASGGPALTQLEGMLSLDLDPTHGERRAGTLVRPLLHLAVGNVGLIVHRGCSVYAGPIELLLGANSDVNATGPDGESILHEALWAWDRLPSLWRGEDCVSPLIRRLLAAGVNATSRDKNGRVPHHVAALTGNVVALRELLQAAPLAAAARDSFNSTLLHYTPASSASLSRWHKDMVLLTRSEGKDKRVPVKLQGFPNRCLETLTTGLAAEVGGVSMRSVAEAFANCGLSQAIYRCSSDAGVISSTIAVRNNFGQTPLHVAAKRNAYSVIELLLEAGADWTVLDAAGQSVFELAVNCGAIASVHVLRKWTGTDAKHLDNRFQSRARLDLTLISSWNKREQANVDRMSSGATSAPAPDPPPKLGSGGWLSVDPTLATGQPDCDLPARPGLKWDEFSSQYLMPATPVIIVQPMPEGSDMRKRWSRAGLLAHYGEMQVRVGPVPRSAEFGFKQKSMLLSEYVTEMRSDQAEAEDSRGLARGFVYQSGDLVENIVRRDSDALAFVNRSQVVVGGSSFYLGPARSGQPLQYRDDVASSGKSLRNTIDHLAFGVRRWILIPPEHARISTVPVWQWLQNGYEKMAREGVPMYQCVQRSGDMVFVPAGWSYAVVHLAESVGFTTALN